MRDYLKRRRDSQPLELPSAGSVFKRPAGNYAGALIEKCGLKGSRIGGAEVSEKHAGFIVNRGGATCEDVKRLIEHIRETVLREYGIMLECEIRII
jgi:UDP-N-acetylmuramate dehydrogenase